jgi:hypothetical protein
MTMKTAVKSMKDYSHDNEDLVMNIKTIVKSMKDYSPDYEDYSKDY